jgi:NAD(P)-dependent dehydrogenase (short-subunit alcohol dehydrogenase family)
MGHAPETKIVLITGCSSGIGRAATELLVRRGHVVYATARRDESVDELHAWASAAPGRAFADRLDVTEPATIAPVVERILRERGRIDVLVNNAGYGQPGAIEDLTRAQWLAQFDANVFGLAEVTRAVLPHLRAQRRGRIINISSVVAHLVTPLMGAYGASKHALDGLSKALRMELRPWGIDVVLVEPGPIRTEFRANVDKNRFGELEPADSAYRAYYQALERHWRDQFEGHGAPAEWVARAVRRAVEARRPRMRYRVTWVARWGPALSALLGDRLTDYFMLRTFGLHRVGAPE